MTELSDDAKAFLDDIRDIDDPMPQAEDRVYGAVLQAVAVGSAATASTAIASGAAAATQGAATATSTAAGAAGASGTAASGLLSASVTVKLLAATLIAGGAVGTTAVVYDAYNEPAPEPTAQHDTASATVREPMELELQLPTPQPSMDNAAPPTQPEDESVNIPVQEAPTAESAPDRRPVERHAVIRPNHSQPAPPPEPPTQPQVDPLVEEVRLMNQADAARRRGDSTLALSLLDQHANQFPHGQLARDRQVSRVLALCDAGRTAEARGLGQRLLARYSGTPLSARIENSCAGAEQ